jgi:hypothetical protein
LVVEAEAAVLQAMLPLLAMLMPQAILLLQAVVEVAVKLRL